MMIENNRKILLEGQIELNLGLGVQQLIQPCGWFGRIVAVVAYILASEVGWIVLGNIYSFR